ncbi:DUF1918 domain-containing protein [Modestobacter sp. NPDC049651]|uniref:DUF1918 domain-containing protein n=1 Tax=unclassified Modestobacter TaxID=2643866 RepID=UPI0033DF9F1E
MSGVRAEVGNWLVVRGRLLDQQVRIGQVVEVAHADGSPPYVVRWTDDDRTSVVFPGSDAVVSPTPPAHRAARS